MGDVTIEQMNEQVERLCDAILTRGTGALSGVSAMRVAQEFGPLWAETFEMLYWQNRILIEEIRTLRTLLSERLPGTLSVSLKGVPDAEALQIYAENMAKAEDDTGEGQEGP